MPVYVTESQNKPGRRRKYAFIILWLLGHALAWGAYFATLGMFNIDWLWSIALGLGGVTSLVQYLLIRWQFGRNIKWWLPLSLLTWLFAAFVPFNASLELGFSLFDITIQALALFGPAALLQAILLRKHVQHSWLWLLVTIAGATTFALGVTSMEWLPLSGFLGYGVYSSTTALSLLWLFGMSQREMPEVAEDHSYKRLLDSDEQEEYEPLYQGEIEAQRKLMR